MKDISEINELGMALRVVSNMAARRICELMNEDEYGITGMQCAVLGYIASEEDSDVFQRDVEKTFRIRRSTATGMLQLMEKNGLIMRTAVPHDARLKKLTLTEEGKKQHIRALAAISTLESQMSVGLTEDEKNAFFRIIAKIADNLGKSDLSKPS